MPGRPTIQEHRHPVDNIRKHYDKHTVNRCRGCTR
jgi:hypothetical protein